MNRARLASLVLSSTLASLVGCVTEAPQPITPPPPLGGVTGGPQIPAFGTSALVPLTASFPDPFIVRGVAGGSIPASSLGSCSGNIDVTPNLRVDVREPFARLRVLVQSSSDLTLVVRGPDGFVQCNDDFEGLNPGIESAFMPGTYDVFVGTFSEGPRQPFALAITQSPSLMPSTFAGVTPTPSTPTSAGGDVLRSGTLFVASVAGSAPTTVGTACTYTETRVVPPAGERDVRWMILCGANVLYGANGAGLGRSSNVAWATGTLAQDPETTSGDGDPAFVWDASSITLRDDTGAFGAFDLHFQETPVPSTTP